jgi:transcriptional regulator with XRE-family HTH domain
MSTSEGQHDRTPGRPLWLAAERKRVAEGWTKGELVQRAGIGRVTYDRLESQSNPPIGRTVKKVADAIGMDYEDALRLAGHGTEEVGTTAAAAPLTRVMWPGSDGVIRLEIHDFDHDTVAMHIRSLRDAADAAHLTLGETLIITGLATAEELALPHAEALRLPLKR